MKDSILENTYFLPRGSNCLSAIVCRWSGVNYIPSCLNNMINKGGFQSIINICNGQFKNELLDHSEFKKKKHSRGINGESWDFENYEVVHLDYDNKKEELRKSYDHTLGVLRDQKSGNKNIYIVISLEKSDETLSTSEIKDILSELEQYIDVSKIIVLGSIAHKFTPKNKEKYKNLHFVGNFNTHNNSFKEVLGDRYMIIEPSNVKELSSRQFYESIKNI